MPSNTMTLLASGVAFLCALLAVYMGMKIQEQGGRTNADVKEVLGIGGAFLFKSLDLDDDGTLDAKEFAVILDQINGKVSLSNKEAKTSQEDGEYLTVEAHFEPLDTSSIKGGKDGLPSFWKNETISKGLLNWKEPAKDKANFNTLDFGGFLPSMRQIDVGKPWHIFKQEKDTYSSNRYFPPIAEGNEAIITELLTMFHPRPFTVTRFRPQGAAAVIRARNSKYMDVTFRIHAEFQLNEPPSWPFWFTPAQFKGNFIISRDRKHIEYFHMYVPSDRKLNVDMEWLTGPTEHENMEVEIGYMPRMELKSLSPSVSEDSIVTSKSPPPVIKWDEEIVQEKAENVLEKAMYPFKQVDYHKFGDAFSAAKESNKLVHSIVMWGALDDQSC